MARSLLVHAWFLDQCYCHATFYATSIFNILPIHGLYTTEGDATTPFHLFTGYKPILAQYCVLGCPVIAKKWTSCSQGCTLVKQTECGVCSIFIFGVPLRLVKSMCGITLSGKFWYIDLMESLVEMGFLQSSSIQCLFYKILPNKSKLFLLNYNDDMLYFGTSPTLVTQFEADLLSHFDLKKLGQAHWYLATCIMQQANIDIN